MSSVLTVSQINTYIKSIIDGDSRLKSLFVSGEISNFTNHYRTGHLYFTLKDEHSCIKAVMFRTAAQRLRFEPENGMKVIIRAGISVFERDGVYQLYCEDMMPDGAGQLSIAFEQLKRRLEAKGMFDESHKKSIPAIPGRIGVITSPTGAAVHDILTVLSRRWPLANVVFQPVQVQGDSAAGEIVNAIRQFNSLHGADVLIVGRGGGSVEDLWAFNEEAVANAIYESEIPVISAVGHETDFTIADFVSDLRAPTPSAAAELAVPDFREVLYSLDGVLDRMTEAVKSKLGKLSLKLSSQEKSLLAVSPSGRIDMYSSCLDLFYEKLCASVKTAVTKREGQLSYLAASLEGASPLKIFQKGYCAVKKEDGTAVKSVDSINENDKLRIITSDGELGCTVEAVAKRIMQ